MGPGRGAWSFNPDPVRPPFDREPAAPYLCPEWRRVPFSPFGDPSRRRNGGYTTHRAPSPERTMGFLTRTRLVLPLLAAALAARSDVLVQYTLPASSLLPTTTSARLTASAIDDDTARSEFAGFIMGNNNHGGEGLYFSILWSSPTPAAAAAHDTFFEFTLTPQAGAALSLTSLTFGGAAAAQFPGSPSSDPTGYALRTSLDGFSADVASASFPTISPTLSPISVPLAGTAFQGVGPVTFRIYTYTPIAGQAALYDTLTVNGSVVNATPEPSALAVVSLGALGTLRRRRRA